MIYYRQIKDGRRSRFKKIVTDPTTNETISEKTVTMPIIILEQQPPFILLYNDDMEVLSAPTSYVNFDLAYNSFNTRKSSASAIRLLYVFLALTGYEINKIGQIELTELIRFLQGLDNNPEKFSSNVIRSNTTVNGYLSIYRAFFKKKKIYSSALFDSKVIKQYSSYPNDTKPVVDRVVYSSNLKTYEKNAHKVPKYITPDEFEKLLKAAIANNDKLAIIMMRLMYCYGLRLGEVLGLTIEDLKETHRDNTLVPMLILRNRLSDKSFQYCKNMLHPQKAEIYHSREYTKMKEEIIIDYPLYEMICDYINDAHVEAMEKYPDNYAKGAADVVSYRDAPDSNHYIFLGKYGRLLTSQTWGNYLKKYFIECDIPLDLDYRENNLSHRFRHGFAMLHAHYREDKVNALELRDMMRHKSLSSTMVYYNLTDEEQFKLKSDFQKELYEMIPSLKEAEDVFKQ